MAADAGCSVHVVDKNGSSKCPPLHQLAWPHASYERRPNVGRDSGTVCDYVAERYDSLPDRLYFTSSNLNKWDRRERLQRALQSDEPSCAHRTSPYPLRQESDFHLAEYEGVRLTEAGYESFGAWYDDFVGSMDDDGGKQMACHNMIGMTTAERIRARPVSDYQRLANSANVSNNAESVHFIERAIGSILGID